MKLGYLVGRLSAAKEYPILVDAVALQRESGRDVRLTLVGEGPLRTPLERLIARRALQDSVRLAGACNHDRIVDTMIRVTLSAGEFSRRASGGIDGSDGNGAARVATWITGIPEIIASQGCRRVQSRTQRRASGTGISRPANELMPRLGARDATCYGRRGC